MGFGFRVHPKEASLVLALLLNLCTLLFEPVSSSGL